ncbi:MAG: glycoside hydrolase family 97 N-terminal domain-containing protein, partial [Bacteroidales bacterium]|nr:glycoside hydrolase family 97 N-terminal domain-containing protein [Bacteroidales bacterium]
MNTILTMLAAAIFSAASPDGKLSVDFSYSDESALCYSISYEGNGMVSPSPLGLVANYADFTRLTLKNQEVSHKTVEYDMDRIKASHVRREANDLILHTVNPDGRLLDIEFMIFDNDVAFRYLVPKDSETG